MKIVSAQLAGMAYRGLGLPSTEESEDDVTVVEYSDDTYGYRLADILVYILSRPDRLDGGE